MLEQKYIRYSDEAYSEKFEEPYTEEALIRAINTCALYLPNFEGISVGFNYANYDDELGMTDEYEMSIIVVAKPIDKKFLCGETHYISIGYFNILEDPYPHARILASMMQKMLKQRFPDKNIENNADVSDLYYDWIDHINSLPLKDRPWFY